MPIAIRATSYHCNMYLSLGYLLMYQYKIYTTHIIHYLLFPSHSVLGIIAYVPIGKTANDILGRDSHYYTFIHICFICHCS